MEMHLFGSDRKLVTTKPTRKLGTDAVKVEAFGCQLRILSGFSKMPTN